MLHSSYNYKNVALPNHSSMSCCISYSFKYEMLLIGGGNKNELQDAVRMREMLLLLLACINRRAGGEMEEDTTAVFHLLT